MNTGAGEHRHIRIGVIGCGGHSRRHGGALAKIRAGGRPIVLAGVCDIDAARAEAYRDEFGFAAAYTNIDDMISAEDPDALLVMTPADSNAQVALELLGYEKPLLIEKPPGRSENEARRLAERARAGGVPIMVSFDRRFNPAMQHARSLLTQMQVDYVEATMLRNRRTEPQFPTETGIHLVDAVHYLVGATVGVESRTLRQEGRPASYVGSLTSNSGVLSRYAILPACGTEAETYVLYGPDATIAVDRMAGSVRISQGGRTEVRSAPVEEDIALATHVAEMNAFLDRLAHGGEFPSTMDDGVLAVRVAHEIASTT